MKKKAAVLAFLGTFLLAGANAAPVEPAVAKELARDFFTAQFASSAKAAKSLECVYPGDAKSLDFVPYYIFNVGEQEGFVIVAGDDNAARTILAYSDKGGFDMENLPSNVAAWLGYYEEGVRAAASMPSSGEQKSEEPVGEIVVKPLLGEIQYNQDAPYNGMCPEVGGRRLYTGCAATALSAIAKYFEYPSQGRGTVNYTTETLRLSISEDLSQSHYDWDNILPTYDASNLASYTQEEKDAVALLMRDAGYGMKMDYALDASGATMNNTLISAVRHLSYDSLCSIRYRDNYDNDREWIALLKTMLDDSIPIYYAGHGDGGGHAFVCDGYDDADFFHFHWGWGGYQDGYFVVQSLTPGRTGIGGGTGGGYSQSQSILYNLVPPQSGKRTADDYRIEARNSISDNALTTESQLDELTIRLSSFINWTAADFDGDLALALYQDGEFLQLISDPYPFAIDGVLGNSSLFYHQENVTLKGLSAGVADGSYDVWVVCKSNRDGSQWNKVHGSAAGATGVSYLPVTVTSEKFSLRTIDRKLTINFKIPVTRNIDVYVYQGRSQVETVRLSSNMGGNIKIFPNEKYTLKFHTLMFDTTTVSELSIMNDTAITVRLRETMTDPYVYLVTKNGNNVRFLWKKNPPQGPEVSPQSYILYLDSVPVATAGSYAPADYGDYTFANISAGIHTVQVRSVFYEDTSGYVGRRVEIEDVANEDFQASDCLLSPNPSADGHFALDVERPCMLQVSTVTGRVLFEQPLKAAGRHAVDLSGYASGMYLLRLYTEDRQSVILKAFIR